MRITVLGSGTSTGVPVIGCDCPVCQSHIPENKRLRCSLYVEHPRVRFLVDCSTDFRQQALRYGIRHVDAVIFTHNHADHINGLDELRVFNHRQGAAINIYADAGVVDTILKRFDYCFSPPQIGGGVPVLNLIEITPSKSFNMNGIEVVPVPIKHGVLDILGFRIGNFAYLTDCSNVPDSSLPLLQGVKVLVVDGLRRRCHSTHFSLDEALAFSRLVNPTQTWFTHIADEMEHFETNASLPPNAQLLHDGQVIELAD